MGELKLAIRSLPRQPSFTMAAVTTLALGIAASTATSNTVASAAASDIYSLRAESSDGREASGRVSPAELFDLVASSDDIVAGALGLSRTDTLATGAGDAQVAAYGVSREFFRVFGIRLWLGRAFIANDREPDAPRVVVLSHRAWQRHFGGEPAVISRRIQVSSTNATIVGVAEPDFDFPAGTDLWFNMIVTPDDGRRVYDAYMRLRPGVSIDALAGSMARVMKDTNRSLVATPLLLSKDGAD